jgi:hypothetical protein
MIAKHGSTTNRYLQGRDTLMAPVMAELIRHQAICLQHPLQDFFILGRSQI